jgi:hypothetical protein
MSGIPQWLRISILNRFDTSPADASSSGVSLRPLLLPAAWPLFGWAFRDLAPDFGPLLRNSTPLVSGGIVRRSCAAELCGGVLRRGCAAELCGGVLQRGCAAEFCGQISAVPGNLVSNLHLVVVNAAHQTPICVRLGVQVLLGNLFFWKSHPHRWYTARSARISRIAQSACTALRVSSQATCQSYLGSPPEVYQVDSELPGNLRICYPPPAYRSGCP